MRAELRNRFSWQGRRISRRVRWLSSNWIVYFVLNEETVVWEAFHMCRQIGLDARGNAVHTIEHPSVSLHQTAVYVLPTDNKERALEMQNKLLELLNRKDDTWWAPAGLTRGIVSVPKSDRKDLTKACINVGQMQD